MEKSLIRVENLVKLYPGKKGLFKKSQEFTHAVDSISFQVKEEEVFGLVGESGCGKTTTGRLIVRLLAPTDGHIYFKDQDVARLKGKELKRFRKETHMIFQDPYASLNPRFSILNSIVEPLAIHRMASSTERKKLALEMLEIVGLSPPEQYLQKFPHELSGGMRQRCSIARALISRPSFIVADEAVSMLDSSVRAGIINLLQDLKKRFKLTYIFITHDLAVSRYITDRIAVMYVGKIVEVGPTEEVIHNPVHPYSKALISAAPSRDLTEKPQQVKIKGMVSSPVNPPPGCRFFERCPRAEETCKKEHPALVEIGEDHYVACYDQK